MRRISPISYVDGLDVFDPATKRWISIESNGTPGRELVLFAGKALEHAAGFPACVHRVLKRQRPRLSFIYEQKYGDYFTHTRHFGD